MNPIFTSLTTLIFLSSFIKARQNYSGNEVLNCNQNDQEKPLESFLYTCNGKNSSCKSFLIFSARFPYNTVPSIATLTSSDQSEIARLNNVTQLTVFESEQEVIIPVNCSCSGRYYQASTTYQIPTPSETYYTIANNTYQGLSSCNSLKRANVKIDSGSLQPHHTLHVPLRCACPTDEQISQGAMYLLTYSITWNDTLDALSKRFSVRTTEIMEANGFSSEHQTIFPFTTILIPIPNEPSSLNTVSRSFNHTSSPLPSLIIWKIKKSNRVLSAAGIAAGGLSMLFLVVLLWIFVFHKKRTEVVQSKGSREFKRPSKQDLIIEIARFDRVLKVYMFEEIKKATRNFSSKRRIEGSVHRGNFNKQVLAVKKIYGGDARDEVSMLYQINHLNIVKLHGFCQYMEDTYLVYEYMKNGSLKQWLGKRGSKDLNRRIRIALDVANGLLYLHNFTKPAYVHNDIRTSNILLDGNMRAKISNFGRATTADGPGTVITRVTGTDGWIAPECFSAGPVSPKADVFAFGGVILELMTERQTVLQQNGLLRNVQAAETELRQLVEPTFMENGGMEYAVQMVRIGSSCLMEDPANRPDMFEVVSALLKLQFNLHKVSGVNK